LADFNPAVRVQISDPDASGYVTYTFGDAPIFPISSLAIPFVTNIQLDTGVVHDFITMQIGSSAYQVVAELNWRATLTLAGHASNMSSGSSKVHYATSLPTSPAVNYNPPVGTPAFGFSPKDSLVKNRNSSSNDFVKYVRNWNPTGGEAAVHNPPMSK
jgi:hypothetical protein